MNSGFANLRASLPMNLKARYPNHKIWGGAKPDIERIVEIWTDCLATYGGPFLFGKQRGMADAMFAPVVTRFLTYDVRSTPTCRRYCDTIMAMPEMHRMGRRREGRARRHRRARHGVLRPAGGSRLAAGHRRRIGHRGGRRHVDRRESAGPTTSRYSMSGE